ncbi:SDR family oxidoreductase [Saprospiraceae bacterium]|nr:SDR family oxidoreductase [Saprospiraceae bacterium]MDB4539829.1 SDR family oxidoreductase [Saprospiraceae bacterium]
MENKNYLVVGGSYGIGLEVVKSLVGQNANVYVLARTEGDLPASNNIHFQEYDVLGEEKIVLPETLNGVVYCPGSINLKPFRSLKPDAFRSDFEINLIGAVKVLQAAQRLLQKTENSSVVLFSTVAVQQGMPYHSSVAASKGAIEGLARTLAAEWAPKVRVNVVAPSLTDTPLAARLLSSDERRDTSAQRHPLKRIGTVSDISEVVCFLLSQKSAWMTGQVLGVDGGISSLKV